MEFSRSHSHQQRMPRPHGGGHRAFVMGTPATTVAPAQMDTSVNSSSPTIASPGMSHSPPLDPHEASASAPILEEAASPQHDSPNIQQDSGRRNSNRKTRIGFPRVRLNNGAQRALSALLLAPLITYFLWRSPAFATTTVCAVVVSLASYEYAWIAHRIHSRFVHAHSKYEVAATCRSSQSSSTTPPHSHPHNQQEQPAAYYYSSNEVTEPVVEELVAAAGKACAVSHLAKKSAFCGSEWLAAVAVSACGTVVSSSVFSAIASTPALDDLSFGGFRIYYSVISSFSAWMCACFTPNWSYGVLLVIEKEIFAALTLYSMKCPINNIRCNSVLHPSMLMLAGFTSITVFRVATARSSLKLFLHLLLDMLGFVYIIGSLFFIVSFVDLDREATYRKLVIALLYVVWAADTGAYFVGQLMDAVQYRHSHPLASHLSARKDYEGTFIAMFFGVAAMFGSSHLLHINGTVAEKLVFAAIAVIVGRVGDLFESLLKRAALVKDSGTIIPGHGGILDRIDALMFAAIVFSRYFGAIIFPHE